MLRLGQAQLNRLDRFKGEGHHMKHVFVTIAALSIGLSALSVGGASAEPLGGNPNALENRLDHFDPDKKLNPNVEVVQTASGFTIVGGRPGNSNNALEVIVGPDGSYAIGNISGNGKKTDIQTGNFNN